MALMPCTSRKKCTMFSGRVSSGKWPRMTIRSKQWYTKVSRSPNSRMNSSIGPVASVRLSWHQELGTEDRWRSNPYDLNATRGLDERPAVYRPLSGWRRGNFKDFWVGLEPRELRLHYRTIDS